LQHREGFRERALNVEIHRQAELPCQIQLRYEGRSLLVDDNFRIDGIEADLANEPDRGISRQGHELGQRRLVELTFEVRWVKASRGDDAGMASRDLDRPPRRRQVDRHADDQLDAGQARAREKSVYVAVGMQVNMGVG